ncbi:MAG: hypothetical protein M3Q39_09560 [Actinomycetota bacterium]|nr:hypothetical protein [Actinomycetota bacterium]
MLGDRYEQARAHDGLAHTHHATGDPDQARHHWCEALALYTDLGVPDADDVQAYLTALDWLPSAAEVSTPGLPCGRHPEAAGSPRAIE